MKLKIKNKKLGLKIVFKIDSYNLSELTQKGEISKIIDFITNFKVNINYDKKGK